MVGGGGPSSETAEVLLLFRGVGLSSENSEVSMDVQRGTYIVRPPRTG